MTTEVTDAQESSRFEIRDDGVLAGFADYRLQGGRMVFPHTEIDPAFGGRGLAKTLIREALDTARARGLQVVPLCSFVAKFIRDNPDYADVVATGAGDPGA